MLNEELTRLAGRRAGAIRRANLRAVVVSQVRWYSAWFPIKVSCATVYCIRAGLKPTWQALSSNPCAVECPIWYFPRTLAAQSRAELAKAKKNAFYMRILESYAFPMSKEPRVFPVRGWHEKRRLGSRMKAFRARVELALGPREIGCALVVGYVIAQASQMVGSTIALVIRDVSFLSDSAYKLFCAHVPPAPGGLQDGLEVRLHVAHRHKQTGLRRPVHAGIDAGQYLC